MLYYQLKNAVKELRHAQIMYENAEKYSQNRQEWRDRKNEMEGIIDDFLIEDHPSLF